MRTYKVSSKVKPFLRKNLLNGFYSCFFFEDERGIQRCKTNIKVVELYRAYHESIHMERHHVYATDNSLRKRLAKFPINPEEPLICSKFTIPMQEIVDAIYECIKKNLKDLEKWDPYKEDRILNLSLGKVIGYGYVQRTDTTHPFQMSAIRVILAAPKKNGRYFAVKTAFLFWTTEHKPFG